MTNPITQSLDRIKAKQDAKKAAQRKHRAEIWADIQAADPGLADFIKEAREVFGTKLIRWRGERV